MFLAAGTLVSLLGLWPAHAYAQPEDAPCATKREAQIAIDAMVKHLTNSDGPQLDPADSLSVIPCAQSQGAALLELLTPFPSDFPLSPVLQRCDSTATLAAARYLKSRSRERSRNRREARGARQFFRKAARGCRSVRLGNPGLQNNPAWGDCLSFVDGKVDGGSLVACLRARVEGFIADIWPTTLPPNVVLIIADDMRKDGLPWMSKTLSAIAQNGVNFTNAFSTHPICGPARASILSGMSSRQSGVSGNGNGNLLNGSDVIGYWMQEGGYRTGLFGKYLHQASAPATPPEGWDEWQELLTYAYTGFELNVNGNVVSFPKPNYSTDVLANSLNQFIKKNRRVPFFAVYAPYAGHAPYTPSQRHEGALLDIDPPRGPNFREDDLIGKPLWVKFLRYFFTHPDAVAIETHRQQLRSLLALDDAVGQLDQTLEKLGLADNTVVIFVSDQGILHGEHWGITKFSAYEEVIRIPLLLRYPRKYPTPLSSDAMVITSDIATTIASLAGISMPPGREGMPLDAVLADPTTSRQHVLIESSGGLFTYPNRAIRNDRWKLIASRKHSDTGPFHFELYDMDADRFELTNLYAEPSYQSTALELREALDNALPLD